MQNYTSHRSTTPPLQSKQQPAKSDQQLLDEAKHALNHYPAGKNYHTNQRLVAIVTGALDKVLTKNGRLAFLSYIYDRKVSTTKLNAPEESMRSIHPDGTETVLQVNKAAVTEGLEPHEHFSLLVWGQPAQLVDGAPWQVNKIVRETAEAFQRTGLGQTSFFETDQAIEGAAFAARIADPEKEMKKPKRAAKHAHRRKS